MCEVITRCFGELTTPPKYIFDLSFSQGIFPDKLKIAKVMAIYKKIELRNYRLIFVLLCQPKILELLMYNCLFKHLTENKILCDKQFEFRNSHPTEHAVNELLDKLLSQFQKKRYTLGIFIDL